MCPTGPCRANRVRLHAGCPYKRCEERHLSFFSFLIIIRNIKNTKEVPQMKEIKKRFVFAVFIVLLVVSGCSRQMPADQPVKNIETFARLYGYVKYFYPGDEAAAMDWDRFAIYGVKKVENAKNTAQLKKTLEELFLPIAPGLIIHETDVKLKLSNSRLIPPDTAGMKVVTWQHLGVGLGNKQSIYKSVRLNRKDGEARANQFGTMASRLDAAAFRGKEIKFKAAVKVAEGLGQLWLRVDRKGKERGFFDNMDNRPIQPGEWNRYEITGKVDTDAYRIFFGCFLRGKGKLWADDFQFYVKEGERWEPVPLENPDFEEDKEGIPPTKWAAGSPSYSFGVTSEAAGKGKKSVSIVYTPQEISGALFEQKAAFGEHISKELGSGLACHMPIALYGTEEQTYPPAREDEITALTAAMKTEVPETLSGNDLYVRLGDIVIAWNVFQHFFPYFDVVKTDWKAELPKALEAAYRDKTDRDFLMTLKKFTAVLKDGHVRASLRGAARESMLPFDFEWIEGRPVITDIWDKTVSDVRVGDVVMEIAGKDSVTAVEELKPYISAATEGWLMYRAMTELLRVPAGAEVKLKLERDGGETVEVKIKPMEISAYYQTVRNLEGTKSKKIKEGMYYLNMDQIKMEEIDALMPELEKARAIICDMRGYPKGNHLFISHLLKEKDTSTKWMRVPRVIYPDYEKVTYKTHGWHLEPLEPRLTAKIFFLTDGRAISYAESYMGFIEHYKLATIVGQPTAGTNGNVNPLMLPGGYYVTWTGMRVVKHDGSQHHGVGIIPHVLMKRTIKGVREGRDEFLEKAIELAEK